MALASDWVSVVSVLLSTILTVSLFLLAGRMNKAAEDRQSRYSTLAYVSQAFSVVDEHVGRKARLDGRCNRNLWFDFDYISERPEVEACVFTILNHCEAIASGIQKGILDADIIEKLRGDAMINTFFHYESYIRHYRSRCEGCEDAWEMFEIWARRPRPNTCTKRQACAGDLVILRQAIADIALLQLSPMRAREITQALRRPSCRLSEQRYPQRVLVLDPGDHERHNGWTV